MLSQLYILSNQLDGRYASDAELHFLDNYFESYALRLSAYHKLRAAEGQIVQSVQARIQQIDPSVLVYNNLDVSKKCERDTLYVLRYSAIALLTNSKDVLKERVLLWLQTIMRSFKNHQRHCDLTYRVIQDVVQQYLTPAESALFCPILELNRQFLGVN